MSSENRKIGYVLSHPETSEVIVSGDSPTQFSPDIFPVDPDEKTTIGLHISLNEFVKIATSVDVGRDIAYGEESIAIWFLWSEVLREYAVVNCLDVANCIDTNESVQNSVNNVVHQTINSFLVETGEVNPNVIDPAKTLFPERLLNYTLDEIAPPPLNCDKDALWAGIRETIERVDQQARNLLEKASVTNDKVEQIFEVIDLVPLLGDTIKDVSDFFTELVPDLLNSYNAYSSPAALDNIACDVFELVCDDCRYPTYEEYLNYLGSFSVAGLSNPATLAYADAWGIIKSMPKTTGSLVWYTMSTWLVMTMYFGGKWNGTYGTKTLAIWASFGEDNPTDNWMVLCDGCEDTWLKTWLPPQLSVGFVVTFGVEDISEERVDGAWNGVNETETVTVEYTVPLGTVITRVEYGCAWHATRLKPFEVFYENKGRIFVNNVEVAVRTWQGQDNSGESVGYTDANIVAGDVIRMTNFARAVADNDGAYIYATKIEFEGTGTTPA